MVKRKSGTGTDTCDGPLRAFERNVGPMPYLFARERVGRAFLVTLTDIALRERMPVGRVTWFMPLLDETSRDDLFGWIAGRVHRWVDWVGLARSYGAHALTSHLLGLVVAHPVSGVGAPTEGEDR